MRKEILTEKATIRPVKASFSLTKDGFENCLLCPHECRIAPGAQGLCGVRENTGAGLEPRNYGRVTSKAFDPIEKKPLRHFHPGSMILSIGSYGCNFYCDFCQNHAISTGQAPYRECTPEEIAEASYRQNGNIGVAYTYNEPLISYEFVTDCARLIKAQGQYNVLVTNGYINRGPLLELLPFIDAMNIDLKAFSDTFYNRIGGKLAPVMETIKTAAERCHVEVTTLIIGGLNDSDEEMDSLAEWLSRIGPIPLHISRFFPNHKMSGSVPTPVETIMRLCTVARRYLDHVYPGNC